MYGPKGPFLLRYGSRDTRHIDFPWVDGLSTDTPGFGASHKYSIINKNTSNLDILNVKVVLDFS